jgi:hypothetical protein
MAATAVYELHKPQSGQVVYLWVEGIRNRGDTGRGVRLVCIASPLLHVRCYSTLVNTKVLFLVMALND